MGRVVKTLTVLIAACLAVPAAAQMTMGDVQVHGFGTWAYAETDGNSYAFGTDDGSWDNAAFSLNLNAAVSERLSVVAQVAWESYGEHEVESNLDFVFAEWRFSDAFKLRMGQVKHPFGIYAEVFDVGTVRPFVNLPQGVYGPTGMLAESYRGLGIAGGVYSDSGWGIQYDVYGGEVETFVDSPFFEALAALGEEAGSAFSLGYDDTVGLRVVAMAPIEGLSFGASFYTGTPAHQAAGEENPMNSFLDLDNRREVYGAHFEYLGDELWIRSEYVLLEVGLLESEGAYLEGAYKLTPQWQVALRWDWQDTSGVAIDPPLDTFKILEHEDIAAAVNYWFSPNLVAKLEYHMVDGMRFAGPPVAELVAAVMTGAGLETETDMYQLGVQFSF